jgi:hypothetical protein
MADKLHFVVGQAVNPQQIDEDGVPSRRAVVEDLVHDLEKRGKLVSSEYL